MTDYSIGVSTRHLDEMTSLSMGNNLKVCDKGMPILLKVAVYKTVIRDVVMLRDLGTEKGCARLARKNRREC